MNCIIRIKIFTTVNKEKAMILYYFQQIRNIFLHTVTTDNYKKNEV